jgi:hypothetical protein
MVTQRKWLVWILKKFAETSFDFSCLQQKYEEILRLIDTVYRFEKDLLHEICTLDKKKNTNINLKKKRIQLGNMMKFQD